MSSEKIYKTVHQYNKETVREDDMKKLMEIAADYRAVKNYVYFRFGGIGSLTDIYPGYTVQNAMTKSGLRAELGMPSVYFNLAVFDALGDIRCQWTRTKNKVLELIGKNKGFDAKEKHYLRFVIKVNNMFSAILNEKGAELPEEIQKSGDRLAEQVNTAKLHRYLCRQVRKFHVRQYTDCEDGFSLSAKSYRYADHGIYVSVKEKRKRIFIPLTDNNQYHCQIYMKLFPQNGDIEIDIPVNVTVKKHPDYINQVGVSVGYHTMLVTDRGNCFGEELGRYQTEYAEWMRIQTGIYNSNRENNPGRRKYHSQKRRYQERLHSYINHELNRFLQTEKPQTVYMVRLPKPGAGGVNKKINHSVTMWQRGYIRKRLEQKCREHSINLIEVLGKNIGIECSACGATGNRMDGQFVCGVCGYTEEEKCNTARNVLKRGMAGKTLN